MKLSSLASPPFLHLFPFILLCVLSVYPCSVECADPPTVGTNLVFVQLQFVSVGKIEGSEQSFSSDFFMLSTWAAPRIDPNYDETYAFNPVLHWMPQLEFINGIGEVRENVEDPYGYINQPSFNSSIYNFTKPDDWIWCQSDQRYQGSFLTPLDMQNFPFDSQKALLEIESFYDYSQVQIVFAEPDKINSLIPANMPEVIGWDWSFNDQVNTDQYYPYNGRTYNRLTVAIHFNRQPPYYMTKIVAGCLIVTFLAIFTFVLNAEEPDRMMGCIGVFAILVTYLFVAAADVPKVPYQTRLDQFMLLCFILVGLMAIIHAFMFYYKEQLKEEEEREDAREEIEDNLHELELTSPDAPDSPKLNLVSAASAAAAAHTQAHSQPSGNRVHPEPPVPPIDVAQVDPANPNTSIAVGAHTGLTHRSARGSTGGDHVNRHRARKARLLQKLQSHSPDAKWYQWSSLDGARKVDVVCLLFFTFAYIIVVISIFQRPK